MKGKVESINILIAEGSNDVATRVASVKDIDCRLKTRSREITGFRLKDTLFGVYLERSEPPKVRLPKTPFSPTKR